MPWDLLGSVPLFKAYTPTRHCSSQRPAWEPEGQCLLQGLGNRRGVKGLRPRNSLGFHLKKQLLGVDVVHQACVIFIHHSQLVTGSTHVQAAHGCGLLQQDNGKEIVHKDLQDLVKFQRKKSVSHHGNKTLKLRQAVGIPCVL